jgi:hypothetical protein
MAHGKWRPVLQNVEREKGGSTNKKKKKILFYSIFIVAVA